MGFCLSVTSLRLQRTGLDRNGTLKPLILIYFEEKWNFWNLAAKYPFLGFSWMSSTLATVASICFLRRIASSWRGLTKIPFFNIGWKSKHWWFFRWTQNQNPLHVPLFVLQSSGSQNPVWDTFVCQRPIINKTVVKQVPVHHHFQILLQFLLNRQIQVLKNFVYFTLSSKFSRSAVTIHPLMFRFQFHLCLWPNIQNFHHLLRNILRKILLASD